MKRHEKRRKQPQAVAEVLRKRPELNKKGYDIEYHLMSNSFFLYRLDRSGARCGGLGSMTGEEAGQFIKSIERGLA